MYGTGEIGSCGALIENIRPQIVLRDLACGQLLYFLGAFSSDPRAPVDPLPHEPLRHADLVGKPLLGKVVLFQVCGNIHIRKLANLVRYVNRNPC